MEPEAKLEQVHRELQTEVGTAGLEEFVALLDAKGEYLRRHMAGGIDPQSLQRVIPVVFGVRKKGQAFLRPLMGEGTVMERLREVVEGRRDTSQMVAAFDDLPDLQPKQRRAFRNLAAELAHFRDPEAVPLETAWVSGEPRSMGALDYLFGRDEEGKSGSMERHEWVSEWLKEQGFYRHLAYVQDLYYAQAYVQYMVEMTKGLGLVDQQFGQGIHGVDYMARLLGVDPVSSRHWLQ